MIEDLWFDAFIVLVVLISLTLFHILLAVFRRVKLNSGGPGFAEAIKFTDPAKKLLEGNYERIQGTLIDAIPYAPSWKNHPRWAPRKRCSASERSGCRSCRL